jgi:hypothetical protein
MKIVTAFATRALCLPSCLCLYLHAEKFLGAPAGLAEEACGVALVHKDDGVVLVCQSLKKKGITWRHQII